jgi:predicted nucleic acid-binding protein
MGRSALGRAGPKTPQTVRVFFDTNILLDVRLRRPGWIESAKAIDHTERSGEALISPLTLANVAYILGDSRLSKCAPEIDWMLASFTLPGIGASEATAARKLGLDDYEDALQYQCAITAGANWFVTRNTKDFSLRGKIRVVTPETFLKKVAK